MEICSLHEYRKRPQTVPLSFKGVTVAQLVQSIAKWQSEQVHQYAVPEDQALQFYVANAAYAQLAQKVEAHQPLNQVQQWLMTHYYEVMKNIGLRAFFYTFLICTREARHGGFTQLKPKVAHVYGDIGFFKNLTDDASTIISQIQGSDWQTKYTLDKFTDLLVLVFEQATFSGGYGGKNWAAVARPLRDFCHGLTTMEMFLDTVWTLAHNNGAIFNKAMMYKKQNDEALLKILDVQRAGQIPSLIWWNESQFVKDHHREVVNEARKDMPDFGINKVDWQAVVDAGALGSYPGFKKTVDKAAAAAAAAKAAEKAAFIAANKAKMFQVTPTEHVTKITRAEL